MRRIVEEAGWYTFSQIAHTIGISEGTIHHILTDHLKLKKFCARWVPHLLTPNQKSKHLRVHEKTAEKYKNYNPFKISNLLTGDENFGVLFWAQAMHK